ncbi:heavy metal-associated domain containing protein [Musa troglodytarum]|uniref:Heavy metal-associated domain containing protein n=1 Tax=Musa troglodytarum TaxID=320322 RepID=A0A9E7FQJ3_9LILI|nr:heavy metal-associated domain containing protein [Musa troglodytarum]
MKGVNFSCVSPASAAICTSIDRRSMVRGSTGRAAERHTTHPRDPRGANSGLGSMSGATRERRSRNQRSRKSSDKPSDLVTPPGSSRFLLNDDDFFDVFPTVGTAPPLLSADQPAVLKPPSSTTSQEQAVHLRVSLHCKACEMKVRKHISKMEGENSCHKSSSIHPLQFPGLTDRRNQA